MAHVISSLRPFQSPPLTALRPPASNRPHLTTTPATSKTATSSAPAAGAANTSAPDFRALFTGTVTKAVEGPGNAAPTAESVFGSNPWVTNPTGVGPGGVYSFNPFYFATAQTAAKVAELVGGSVVQSSQFTPNGGPFLQQQQNQMVRLADGRLINPGLVASFYTHGYSQSYIDQMVAAEVRNC
jgi:hypothetical protein